MSDNILRTNNIYTNKNITLTENLEQIENQLVYMHNKNSYFEYLLSNIVDENKKNLIIRNDKLNEPLLEITPIEIKSKTLEMEVYSRIQAIEEIIIKSLGVSEEYICACADKKLQENKESYKNFIDSINVANKLTNNK